MASHVRVTHKFTADGSGRDGYIHRAPKWLHGKTHTEHTQYDHMAKVNEFWNGIDKKENSIKERGLSTAPASLTDSQRRRERVSVNKSNQKNSHQQPISRSYNENSRYYNKDDLSSNRVQHIPGYSGHIQRTPDSIGLSTFGEKTPNIEGTTYNTEYNASLPLPSFQAVEVERKQMKRDELLDSLQKHSVARTKPSKQLTSTSSSEPSGLVRKYHMRSPVKTSQKTASHHIVGYTGHQSNSSDAYLNYSLPTRHGE